MPNIMGVLRAEIRRLARKETKQEVGSLRKQVAAMRRRVAQSKRQIRDLENRLKQAARGPMRQERSGGAGGEETDGKQVRFSPNWVKKHRRKLGLSRRLYAQLIGVSPQTIMGWEAGRTRPRRAALRTWRQMRAKGVRELKAALEGGASPRRGRPPRKRGKRGVGRPARVKRPRPRKIRASRKAARRATTTTRRRKRAGVAARARRR